MERQQKANELNDFHRLGTEVREYNLVWSSTCGFELDLTQRKGTIAHVEAHQPAADSLEARSPGT